MARYLALLRGINVGGKNPVAMADLRAAFEDAGFASVRTHLQSGNVLFETAKQAKGLEDEIERKLEKSLGVPLVVLVRSERQLKAVVEKAPGGFGKEPDKYYSDALFLKAPLTSKKLMELARPREGVDQAWPGTGVLYWARLTAKRTQTRLSGLMTGDEYKLMSVRSWSTTTKLLELIGEDA